MMKRLRELLARINVWHLLRLPSLGDVRAVLDASSETIRRQKELEKSVKRLNKKLGAFQKEFQTYTAQYSDDTMELNARLVRIEGQNELAQKATLDALHTERETLANALQQGDASIQKVLQANQETFSDSLQATRKTFAAELRGLEKTVKEKTASLDKIHDEIVSSRNSVSSAVRKYEALSKNVDEMYKTITEAIAKSTNDSVSANRDFRAQLKKCVGEFTEQKNIHFAIEQHCAEIGRHCAEVEQHCGEVELRCAETEQLSAELMNYLRLLIVESVAEDINAVVRQKSKNKTPSYSLKTSTV